MCSVVRFGKKILLLYLAYSEGVLRRCVECKKKYSLVMSHALVNFSLSPRLEIWGMLLGLGLGFIC